MKFIGGHPALDFVNTVGGWMSGIAVEDKLETFGDLIRWAELTKILGTAEAAASARLARTQHGQAAKVLARARSLRGALHRVFDCFLESRTPNAADLRAFQRELGVAREQQVLAAGPGGFHFTWNKQPAVDAVLWRVSQSAADLLTSADLGRVRRCAGENCGWMFLDKTRNHSRHWCDMKDCGNLAKVRRFRERRARR